MQTFLPFKQFNLSAQALDNKRLNKQILEGYQILKVLSNNDPHAGWRNHPAVKMWRRHENALWIYIMFMVVEADERGIKTVNNVNNLLTLRDAVGDTWGDDMPEWYRNDAVMAKVTTTHKANLYRKDSIYYADFVDAVMDENNEPCCEKCNYYWVTHKEN
jgi:hypothetical protein